MASLLAASSSVFCGGAHGFCCTRTCPSASLTARGAKEGRLTRGTRYRPVVVGSRELCCLPGWTRSAENAGACACVRVCRRVTLAYLARSLPPHSPLCRSPSSLSVIPGISLSPSLLVRPSSLFACLCYCLARGSRNVCTAGCGSEMAVFLCGFLRGTAGRSCQQLCQFEDGLCPRAPGTCVRVSA